MTNLMPDISNHQPALTPANAAKVAATCGAIMFKCSQGVDFIDGMYHHNAASAESVNLPYNAYHAVSGDAAAAQVAHVMKAIAGTSPAAVMVDWEQWQKPQTTASKATADAVVRGLAHAVPRGTHIVEYVGVWARTHGGPCVDVSWIMVPAYGYSNADQFVPPGWADKLAAWQYTNGVENGTAWPSSIPGIGPCDVSFMYHPEVFGVTPPKPPKPVPKLHMRYVVEADNRPTKVYKLYPGAALHQRSLLRHPGSPKVCITRKLA